MGKHGAKRSPDGQIGLVYEVRGGVKQKNIYEGGDINIRTESCTSDTLLIWQKNIPKINLST
jgi:hypothetical protein